jgi:C4-dicarboxylate-specific signal transduction histidine kinase
MKLPVTVQKKNSIPYVLELQGKFHQNFMRKKEKLVQSIVELLSSVDRRGPKYSFIKRFFPEEPSS